MRRILLVVFIAGSAATIIELLFLGHFEDTRQVIPVFLLVAGLCELGFYGVVRKPKSLKIFQVTMVLFFISGVLGIIYHYQGNQEFALEGNPSLSSRELIERIVKGGAPILGPGMMIQFGFLGLAFTYRHPHLTSSVNAQSAS